MSPPARLLTFMIGLYRRMISPLFAPHCRYHPTCSEYALTAIARFGAFEGVWLALRRVARCHPWAAGGIDHVQERSGVRPDKHRRPAAERRAS